MRQKRSQSSDTPGTTAPAAPTRGRAGTALTALVAAACGALVFTYAEPLVRPWTSIALTEPIRLLLALDSALLLVALVATLGSARGTRRTKGPSQDVPLTEEPLADAQDAQDASDEVRVDVRVLQAQIRSLEEALAQQEATRTAEPEPEPHIDPEADAVVADQSTRDEVTREVLHRVRCTVRGLGVRMEGDPVAADILARVDAAVDRLAATGLFERPTLSEPDHTLPLPQDLAVPPVAETAPLEVPEEEPVETPVAAPAPLAADEPEVVLPVPPSPPAPQVQRGRRWLRRSTAA